MTSGIVEAVVRQDNSIRITVIGTGGSQGKFRAFKLYYTNASGQIQPEDTVWWHNNRLFWTPRSNVECDGKQYVDWDVEIGLRAMPWDPAQREVSDEEADNLMDWESWSNDD